jgi:Notch-like protein
MINKLNMTNSFGYDEIPIKILKSNSYYISSPLTYIINRSLETGIFPDRLKFSEIIPIYKNGDKNLISNYRPISILTSFSKIFEEVICTILYNNLVNFNILANEQFAFRANSSTNKATHKLLDQIQMALNDGHKVGGIFSKYYTIWVHTYDINGEFKHYQKTPDIMKNHSSRVINVDLYDVWLLNLLVVQ